MSSVGHQRGRRPSLFDFDNLNRFQCDDVDGKKPTGILIAYFEQDDTSEEILLNMNSGKKLYEVFEEPLRRRGMNVNDVIFLIEKSNSPIPEHSEARFLLGCKLYVKARPMPVSRHSRATHSMDDVDRPSRKLSQEAISRKSSFVNSKMLAKSRQPSESRLNGSDEIMLEGRSNDSSLRDLSIADEPCSSDQLSYDDGGTRRARSTTGSRVLTQLFAQKDKSEFRAHLSSLKNTSSRVAPELQENWKLFVGNIQSLSKRQTDQQEAIWELITTESRYIQVLKMMSDFKDYLKTLQQCGYLSDIICEKVFLNCDALYCIHMNFWTQVISVMIDEARETGTCLNPSYFDMWFSNIQEWSVSYSPFIQHHNDSLCYLRKCQKDNGNFSEFVAWCESQQNMQRQKLADMLTMPMQRLTRYSLLLKAIRRSCTDKEENDLIFGIIERVDSAAHALNYEMNNNDNRQQLIELGSQIDYEFIDQSEYTRIFRDQPRCVLDLVNPMPGFPAHFSAHRRLFYKGELRLREAREGGREKVKENVVVFIFTDLLLICRKKGDRLQVARPPIHITNVLFCEINESSFHLVHMNVFRTPSHMYIMSTCSSDDSSARWWEMFRQAQAEFGEYDKASRRYPYDPPMEDGRFYQPPQMVPMGALASIVHRKSSSMDSQVMAANPHLNHVQRTGTVSKSTDQLDRSDRLLESPQQRYPPRHKLSVASCVANPLSSSKSSGDLHFDNSIHFGDERPRSRSNSSGPEIEGKLPSRSPSPVRRNGDMSARAVSPVNGIHDDGASLLCPHDAESPPTSGRRFEKRYHTADAIDMKPKGTVIPGGILKRFSWNVSSAVGASSRKISARLGDHSRRHSQASTAASSESFGSSTSGISSSSDNAEIISKPHVTSVAVNESPAASNLNISLSMAEETEIQPSPRKPPPVPDLATCKQQELLKFILENQLETSDV